MALATFMLGMHLREFVSRGGHTENPINGAI